MFIILFQAAVVMADEVVALNGNSKDKTKPEPEKEVEEFCMEDKKILDELKKKEEGVVPDTKTDEKKTEDEKNSDDLKTPDAEKNPDAEKKEG